MHPLGSSIPVEWGAKWSAQRERLYGLDGDWVNVDRSTNLCCAWTGLEWIAHIDTDANNLPVDGCTVAVNRVKNVYTKMDVV